ncbi:MAG TPA: zf-HC2 domain-containing protein [Acidimicrobiales bacterium]|nr:zf-HC2 domain-containing protein [Acidimicrobiales bacterium]
MTEPQAPPEHPHDLLSAYLDGELDRAHRRTVERHLAGCEDCREELASVQEARSWLRGLQPVDPPSDWLDRLWRRWQRLLRLIALVAAGGGAVAAGVAWATAPPPLVGPPSSEGTSGHGGEGVPVKLDQLSSAYRLPTRIGDMSLAGLYHRGSMVTAEYTDGEDRIDLFEQVGQLDPARVVGAEPRQLGSEPAVSYWWNGKPALTWQDGSAVYTVAGEPGQVSMAANSLMASRPPGEGLLGRFRRLCRQLVEDVTGGR